jgi:hypothetical protein
MPVVSIVFVSISAVSDAIVCDGQAWQSQGQDRTEKRHPCLHDHHPCSCDSGHPQERPILMDSQPGGMPATQSRRGILPLGLETIIVIRQSLTEIRLRLIESA